MAPLARMAIVIASMVSIGCATQPLAPEDSHGIVDAEPRTVEACEYLGTVSGQSVWGNVVGGAIGVPNAQAGAMKAASAIDATHLVWTDIDRGSAYKGASATGRAYRCTVVAEK